MYEMYKNGNGLTWLVKEKKDRCEVIYLGKDGTYEKTLYRSIDDFKSIYGLTLRKVED